MKTKTSLNKVISLFCLVVVLGAAALPLTPALAAGETQTQDPPVTAQVTDAKLTAIWTRLQDVYDRQGRLLDRAEKAIDLIQGRLDLAASKGLDTSAVQAALDVFADAVKDAQQVHQSAHGIIASHKGFTSDGLVTDRPKAVETIRDLAANLKEVRSLVKDPFILLRQAIIAFKQANHPTTTP